MSNLLQHSHGEIYNTLFQVMLKSRKIENYTVKPCNVPVQALQITPTSCSASASARIDVTEFLRFCNL